MAERCGQPDAQPSAISRSAIDPPHLSPRSTVVVSLERNDPVLREVGGFLVGVPTKQGQQPRQMREMAGDEDVTRLAAKPIAHPQGGVSRLKVTCGGKLRQRVARAPADLSGLPGAQLAAVPHDARTRAAPSGIGSNTLDAGQTFLGQGPARVDRLANSFAVVD
jgi:hypothetical protein